MADFDAAELRLDSHAETSPRHRRATVARIVVFGVAVLLLIALVVWMIRAGR